MKKSTDKKFKLLLMFIFSLFVFIISFGIGRYKIDFGDIVKVFASKFISIDKTWKNEVETVMFQVRLPRIIAATLIGSSLSVAGAVYQGLFRNPMVSPEVLGASSGAGFGAALGILLNMAYASIATMSFSFGLLAVFLAYNISKFSKLNKTLSMVLGGIMIGSIFSSLISFLKLVADPINILPSITYWLMGSLASIKISDIKFASIPIIVGLIPIILLRWRLNLLTMGEEEAKSMGVNTSILRVICIICASLVTAASVSISGMIGWIGLVIPHFARLIVGYDYKYLIPACIFLGSGYLLIIDDIARILTTSEIPIGILTSLVGAPVFLILLLKEEVS
ncbi:MAG: iron ABC transporter permease [Tissierellia bacterium]|nr:iron ABC transporter permease [Tissierellia bacterium]